ncbi:hypothetical protein ABZ807_26275 [Micromonospora sp. NPDC047548]|uniref:hypothetical protein n=1 Tax=Micromonospora sp. NPDC047548 TaxID=3155624 RepID=UPI0033F670D8
MITVAKGAFAPGHLGELTRIVPFDGDLQHLLDILAPDVVFLGGGVVQAVLTPVVGPTGWPACWPLGWAG